jgi:hypothetical protein
LAFLLIIGAIQKGWDAGWAKTLSIIVARDDEKFLIIPHDSDGYQMW